MFLMLNVSFAVLILCLVVFSIFDLVFFFYGFKQSTAISKRDVLFNSKDVTIQVPIYNTGVKLMPLLESLSKLPYQFNVQLLDSSDDDTTSIILRFFGDTIPSVDSNIKTYSWKNISLIHFNEKQGNKSWALNEGTKKVDSEFIAVFDADWSVTQDFFERLLPVIKSDSNIGFVQASWRSLNEDESLIAYTDAVSVETEHLLEDVFRSDFRIPFTIHGSAFIVRTSLVKENLWRDLYLSEDVDLAFRICLQGYHAVYIKDQKSHGLTCPSVDQFFRQKSRWIEGRAQMLKTHFFSILKNDELNWFKKIFLIHYLGYFFRFPIFIFVTGLAVLTANSSFILIALLALLLSVATKALLNIQTISLKDRRNFFSAPLEPLLFWMFALPFSFFIVRGFFVKKRKWR